MLLWLWALWFWQLQHISCSEARGILVPRQGIEPASLALQGRFLTTGPPGMSLTFLSCFFSLVGQSLLQFSSVFSRVRLFATQGTTACQASLSITNSRSPPKPMSIESVMPSNHLILCCPLLLLPSIFPSIRVFSNESALCIRWPKYYFMGW